MSKRRGRDKQRQPVPQPSSPAPENVRRIVQREISMSATFSGPLPPPDILIKYNDAVPDGAERIIVMAERQSEHRMKMETRVTNAGIVRANLGLAAGFIVALAFLGVAYLLIDGGHAWAGGTLGALNIAAIVGTFVYGTVANSRERQRRARMMAGES